VSPVIEDPWVQSALADRISQEVLTYVDVQQIANKAVDALAAQGLRPQLVDRLRDLTRPLADGVAGLVRDRVGQLVASPQFTAAWNRAVQVAHEQANAVLSDEAASIAIKDGMVVLDLGPFIDAAKQHLVDSGFGAASRIPQVHPTVDLFAASTLVDPGPRVPGNSVGGTIRVALTDGALSMPTLVDAVVVDMRARARRLPAGIHEPVDRVQSERGG
jgi:hypothetical protein